MISGFLISSIIFQDLQSETFSIIQFYIRRIRRIYPALFIVLCAVCLAGWVFLLPSDYVTLGKQILGGSTFSANFVLWWQSGYFSSDAALKPLLHLWSLGVEEQYYLIFPLICVVLYRQNSRRLLAAGFLGIGFLSMLVNVVFVSRFSAATFFLPFSRLWELIVGAALALSMRNSAMHSSESHKPAYWRHWAGIIGLTLLAIALFAMDQFDAFPGWWALLPVAGSAMVIAAGEDSWANRHILSSKPAVIVGLISYPLYLWHWPILSFMRIATNSWGIAISKTQKWGLVLLAFLLAAATYRLVELPIRRVRDRQRRRNGALILVGCVALTGAFGVFVIWSHGFPARLPKTIVALDHDNAEDASNLWREGTCFLRPDQSAASFPDSCVDSQATRAAAPLVFVWGDSHAADLLSGFRTQQSESKVRLAQYTASMCAPILGLDLRERPQCRSINDVVFKRIKGLMPEIVVLSAYWDYADPDHDRQIRAAGLERTISLLKAAGIRKVVVVGSVPFWKSAVPGLLSAALRRNPDEAVPHRLGKGSLTPHDDRLLIAAASNAGAVYVPIFENLCDQSSCLVTTGATWKDLLIYDQSHFTDHGSVLISERIWSSIIAGQL